MIATPRVWLAARLLTVKTSLFLAALSTEAATTEAIASANAPASVVILAYKDGTVASQGSGCVIDRRGVVLCTAHQVANAGTIEAVLSDGSKAALSLLEADPVHDAALLKANRPLAAISGFAQEDSINNGARVVAITAPAELSFTVSEGIVSNARRTLKGQPKIQTSLTLAPGSSGGPVFDAEGRLIGIIGANMAEVPGQTIVTPVYALGALLSKHGVNPSGQTRPELPMPPGASRRRDEEEIQVAGLANSKDGGGHPDQAIAAFQLGVSTPDQRVKISAYETAVRHDPAFFEAWFNLGVSRGAADNLEGAIEAYRRALEIRPDSIEALRNQGLAWLRLGKPDLAIAPFEKARELDPGSPQAYNDLGEALRRVKRLDDAVSSFKQAVALRGDYPEAHYNLALAYLEQEKHPAAVKHFEEYLRASPAADDRAEVEELIQKLTREQGKQ